MTFIASRDPLKLAEEGDAAGAHLWRGRYSALIAALGVVKDIIALMAALLGPIGLLVTVWTNPWIRSIARQHPNSRAGHLIRRLDALFLTTPIRYDTVASTDGDVDQPRSQIQKVDGAAGKPAVQTALTMAIAPTNIVLSAKGESIVAASSGFIILIPGLILIALEAYLGGFAILGTTLALALAISSVIALTLTLGLVANGTFSETLIVIAPDYTIATTPSSATSRMRVLKTYDVLKFSASVERPRWLLWMRWIRLYILTRNKEQLIFGFPGFIYGIVGKRLDLSHLERRLNEMLAYAKAPTDRRSSILP